MEGPAITFTLDVPPGSLAAVRRSAGLQRSRSAALTLTWSDTPEGDLAKDGRATLSWREGRRGGTAEVPVPGENADAALLADASGAALPDTATAICTFTGRRHRIEGDVRITLFEGQLVSGAARQDVARAVLAGPAEGVAAIARAWPGARPPRAGLSATALALAGLLRPSLPAALPALTGTMTLSAAMSTICRHFAALLQALAPEVMTGVGSEPVHQMRVAVRRLRSAFRLVRRVLPCPALTALGGAARTLGHALGPARDWDVFLAGLGRDVAAAFPDERAMGRMLAAARRQRAGAYAALREQLDGEAFRLLLLDLTLAARCAPWDVAGDVAGDAAGDGARDLAHFAAASLSRQWRRLLSPGRSLDGLPEARLHAIRLEAKRMRYAAELFDPLFPRRDSARLIARLKAVQDVLGHLNDGATARGLMARLGAAGQGFAGGAVHGYVAAAGGAQRGDIEAAWRRLRKAPVFWD